MVFQPEYGHILGIPLKAGENLPYYRFTEIKDDTIVLATGKGTVVGVTVPSVQDYIILRDGTTQKRNGYIKDEQPQLMQEGLLYIELEGAVKLGDRLKCVADGKASKQDKSADVVGIALEDGNDGQLVRTILKIR